MTKPNLQDIKNRYEAATPGTWEIHGQYVIYTCPTAYPYVVCNVGELTEAVDQNGESDGKFIAHARTDVPALVAALEAVIEDSREALETEDDEPYDQGRRARAATTLARINQHLTIGDKQ